MGNLSDRNMFQIIAEEMSLVLVTGPSWSMRSFLAYQCGFVVTVGKAGVTCRDEERSRDH